MKRWYGIWLACLLLFTSCTKQHAGKIAFYFWKQEFKLNQTEKDYLNHIGASKLYIRLFDIDSCRDEICLLAPCSIVDPVPAPVEVIPVVYITREAILRIQSIDSVATVVANNVHVRMNQAHLNYSEVQWDMDWTPRTRDTYFKLLESLRKQACFRDKKFSATLRLHQVKYRSQCGIPPVDRVSLMCYNMGNLKDYSGGNSIYQFQKLKDYTRSLSSYPLNADFALPMFHWVSVFRNRRWQGLIRTLQEDELKKNAFFKNGDKANEYQAAKNGYIHGIFIQKGDEFRYESVSLQDLQNLVPYLLKHANQEAPEFIFFHLDSNVISQYPVYEIHSLLDSD
ncbi:MAG TPA: hypothetical protein PLP34_07900 [Chitinophagaceae bacterium]|nr:hypothetical protein [Chitinophagaceae bacterium]